MSKGEQTLFKITDGDQARAEAQIRQLQKEVDFNIRDFPIDYLVAKFREELYYIPTYQREFVWRLNNRCAFIESVILGLPIPLMFFAEMDDGRFEIVDGAQRMNTLESFMSNDLQLRGLEKLKLLKEFRFRDLPLSQRRKFESRPMRIVILDEATTVDLRYELFKRINTRGERARPSEIRKGAYAGPFLDFLQECGGDDRFLKLCPITDSLRRRREPQELVLRFFAYSDRYKKFRHDVHTFLNKYAEDHRTDFDHDRLSTEFSRMLEFVMRYFPHGFAKASGAKSTPRVRFEAISVGVNLACRVNPDVVPRDMGWLDSEEFLQHTTTHASNSQPRLAGRVEYVRDRLLGV